MFASFTRSLIAILGFSAAAVACSATPSDRDDADSTAASRDEGGEEIGEVSSSLELAVLDRCSTGQKRTLRASERLAKYILHPSIVEKYTRATLPDGGPNWMLARFFDRDGTWDQATADKVRNGLRRIYDRISEGDVVVRCREILACKGHVNAYVIPVLADKITFCPGFFEGGGASREAYQASVWVHELAHEILRVGDGAGDGAYGSPSAPLSSEALRKNTHPELVGYVNAGREEAAEQWEAFAYALIGQYFDDGFRARNGRAITESELAGVFENIYAERGPFAP